MSYLCRHRHNCKHNNMISALTNLFFVTSDDIGITFTYIHVFCEHDNMISPLKYLFFLTSEGLDKDLHARTATKTKHEVKSGLLLDVVVSKGAAVFELLAGKDETLLVRGDTFLVLDLLLHGLDAVAAVNVEGDGLA